MLSRGNIFKQAEPPAEGERLEVLLETRNLMVERILSSSRIESQEYRQIQDEWVMLLKGNASMDVDGDVVELVEGDYLFLPSGKPHTVTRVSEGAIWLAVHLI